MGVANIILSILGLAPYAVAADEIITVGKEGFAAIAAAKAMLDSPEGQKFKQALQKVFSEAEKSTEVRVTTLSTKAHEIVHPVVQEPAGRYVWDGFEGWVWEPEEQGDVKNNLLV
jgi:hypothetical protein